MIDRAAQSVGLIKVTAPIASNMFWGGEVTASKPLKFVARGDMKISWVTLGAETGKEKIALYLATSDKPKSLICYLQEKTSEQKGVEIPIRTQQEVAFELSGAGPKTVVYLMGVEVPDDFYQDQDDAASGSEELISDDEGDEEDDDETDEGKQKIIAAGIKSVSDAQKKAADSAAKKPKLDTPKKPAAPKAAVPKAATPKNAAPAKPAAAVAKPAASPAAALATGKWTVTKQGLKFMDLELGKGAPAKIRDRVAVQYRGSLPSGKVFDSGTFRFMLGAGEVIRGWDIGVAGMQVGGKRKLVIPPELGYGRSGAPPAIPPNAELHFDVALKGINPPTKKEKKSGRKRQGSPPRR